MNKTSDDLDAPASSRELQQHAIAELGQRALGDCTFEELCEQALDDLTRCLNLRYVKLLELSPGGEYLTMVAGRGWSPGLVGRVKVPKDSGSQAGFSLQTAETVVVQDFDTETRFAPPKLLSDHGIRCGASVIIGPVSNPWGVLGVHESELGRCSYDRYDIDFVRSIANILWLFVKNAADRAKAETERQALRSLADAMPILFAVVNRQGRYEFVNDAYRVFGEPGRLIGKRVRDVIGDKVYETAAPYVERALRGEVTRFETRLPLQGERERDVLVTYAPRWRGEGRVDGFYAVVVDISDQKDRQREILERTQHYQAIADSIPYGIWTCDAAGKLTYVSESFLELIGMTFDEARDFGWVSRLIPEEAEEIESAWKACVTARQDWKREHRVLGGDGRTYDILAIARPVIDSAGRLTSYVGLNLDMTEWKQREDTLKLLARELDHRVKNVFSLVLTIARMASRTANDVEAFRTAFEGRIQSLSVAHELIAEADWRGMSLRQLFEAELAPYDVGNISVEGGDVFVAVEAVQPLALAVHELATNAAKYGALSRASGKLNVILGGDVSGGVSVDWLESGLVNVPAPAHSGFGTKVLERVLAIQLGAVVEKDFRSKGLHVKILLPGTCLGGSR
jgi:PAS domain S-box-containing protein